MSTTRTREEQDELVHSHLRKNDYPRTLINRMLRKTPVTNSMEKPATFRSIPYIRQLTPSIKKILQNSNTAMGISYSNQNTVGRLYKTAKDPVPNLNKSNVIYKIDCRDCHYKYIGMTTNKLRTRMYGHQSHINVLDEKLREGNCYTDPAIQQLKEKTALIEHCITHQHRFNINNPSIIDITYKRQASFASVGDVPHRYYIQHRQPSDRYRRSQLCVCEPPRYSQTTERREYRIVKPSP